MDKQLGSYRVRVDHTQERNGREDSSFKVEETEACCQTAGSWKRCFQTQVPRLFPSFHPLAWVPSA